MVSKAEKTILLAVIDAWREMDNPGYGDLYNEQPISLIVRCTLGDIRRLCLQAPTREADETGWLIEIGGPAYYGDAREDGLGWTSDHAAAIRFARKEDAERVIQLEGFTEASAVEHIWTPSPTDARAAIAKAEGRTTTKDA